MEPLLDKTRNAASQDSSLATLLPPTEIESLCRWLALLLDGPVAIQDLAGTVIAGTPGLPADARVELTLGLEAVGYLQAPQATPRLRAAASLLSQLLLTTAQHQALGEQVDERIADQVKLLDERQRQAYQAERLASVSELAAGVAHEINNPIGFVRSNLGTAQTYLDKLRQLASAVKALPGGEAILAEGDTDFTLEDFSELLRDSIAGVDRVARIVRDLKGFSNVDQPEEDVVDVNGLLGTACRMAEKQLPPGAALICELGVLKPLLCLPGHLAQAFLAVLTNAVQAIEKKGADGELRVCSRSDGQQTVIEVRDNGVGIEPQVLSRVFDPFFTTRPVGKGTGLGLTVARDIVRAHGGEIEFASIPEVGTTVTVSLPE
ncbi:sensor histidine kinase [Accumulibacter sp.]|uniref:sensor histidine kinase n=1 Tax=Accumulibacter sp. TaxID=2053492 RepID=UPI0028C4F279|nr:ATP-binding protein [Accumulibacter sp.]